MRILLVEDDASLARTLATILRGEHFTVDHQARGVDALHLTLTERYDAIVLDVGVPGLDGFAILKAARDAGIATPVLMLTARDRLADKAQAFRAGADDYMTKPFAPEEVVLRLHALIRRAEGRSSSAMVVGDLSFDPISAVASQDGRKLELTHLETKVLGCLMRRVGAVVSRTEMSEAIYELDGDASFNTIEVMVSRLRRKIGKTRISTVRGGGYRLEAGDHAVS